MTIERLIHESNLIEGFNSSVFDNQGLIAWNYLQDVDRLTIGHINKVQKLLTLAQKEMQPDWRGYIRKIPVYIGGHEAMKVEFIEVALKAWLKIEPETDPIRAHILYESIHPHVDGNGRTGRLLLWWRQQKNGHPFEQITNDDKWRYYDWFKAGKRYL